MTSRRLEQIEAMYHATRDREPGERGAFLAEACRGDEELRRQVESLLDQDGREGVMERPALEVAADLLADSATPRVSVRTQLGPYLIEALLGTGGMGEVYQALDTRLNRIVAIKVLAERFSERFEREAHAIAALNHPNICTLHDIGSNYLVMELIEGRTLAERLREGSIPLDEALAIAGQIADGLAAAHEKGIIHRDLKPSNIKITPSGTVKILDFGLAKLAGAPVGESNEGDSPRLAAEQPTRAGVIVGTAAYMSPEQARGDRVDKRTDIWAFGVVLYEMLTGHRPFGGATLSDTLAAVLKDEPGWGQVPPRLRRLLRSCLNKASGERLHDIADAKLLVEEDGPLVEKRTSSHPWLRWVWLSAGAVLVLAVLLFSFARFRATPPPEQSLRYTISAPPGSTIQSLAISPDGRDLVIAAAVGRKRELWLRPMDSLQAQPMPVTEDATYPFWSPDSRYIGFFAQGKLKKISASGGPAQLLCDVPNSRGGSWSRDNVIIFSPGPSGISIQRVSASGGTPVDVMRTKGDQRQPVFMPDGRHFLYQSRGEAERSGIYFSSLDGQENRRVLADFSGVAFAAPRMGERIGHILFARENSLMAAPFNAATGQISGDVFQVAEGIFGESYLPVTVSTNGLLLYATYAASTNQIGWYDRAGRSLGTVSAPGNVYRPSISPDEKSVAFERGKRGGADLWVRDLKRGTETQLTSNASYSLAPIWSPKGDRILFASNRAGGVTNLYQRTGTGSGQDELLLPNSLSNTPSQWSKDGRFIVYVEDDPKSKADLWVLPAEEPVARQKPRPFLRSEFNELFGQLSPDSLWMAFTSDRSGRREVYVRPFPSGEGEWIISIEGGQAPRWRGDGKELFFEAADGKMMAVPVKVGAGAKPSFEVGVPVALFDAHMVHQANDVLYEYDVTQDGKRFLMNTAIVPHAASAPPLSVVTNWYAVARKRP